MSAPRTTKLVRAEELSTSSPALENASVIATNVDTESRPALSPIPAPSDAVVASGTEDREWVTREVAAQHAGRSEYSIRRDVKKHGLSECIRDGKAHVDLAELVRIGRVERAAVPVGEGTVTARVRRLETEVERLLRSEARLEERCAQAQDLRIQIERQRDGLEARLSESDKRERDQMALITKLFAQLTSLTALGTRMSAVA